MTSQTRQFLAFFAVFYGIYGGVHVYVWWRCVRLLGLRAPLAAPVLAAFLLLAAAPFLGRVLRPGLPGIGTVETVAFLWMGLVFYLFVAHLAAQALQVAWRLARAAAPDALPAPPGGPALFWCVSAVSLAIVAWASVEASRIRLVRVDVPTPKLAAGSPPIRIAQVSDIHLGLLLGERRLGAILARVREAAPDLLVATGDVVDAVGDDLPRLASLWREVRPPLGAFAVTGNHEYYAGLEGSVRFLSDAGFRVLRDEAVSVAGRLNLVGREYRGPRTLRDPSLRLRPLSELVAAGDPHLPTVVLYHEPRGFREEAVPAGADLQLSGHTHDGQLWPFRWLVRLNYPFTAGLLREGGSLLYVSRGTGTWGPPLRFLAPPEVTLFEIRPATPTPSG